MVTPERNNYRYSVLIQEKSSYKLLFYGEPTKNNIGS